MMIVVAVAAVVVVAVVEGGVSENITLIGAEMMVGIGVADMSTMIEGEVMIDMAIEGLQEIVDRQEEATSTTVGIDIGTETSVGGGETRDVVRQVVAGRGTETGVGRIDVPALEAVVMIETAEAGARIGAEVAVAAEVVAWIMLTVVPNHPAADLVPEAQADPEVAVEGEVGVAVGAGATAVEDRLTELLIG